MEILEDDKVVYDLTDFLETVKVYNLDENIMPSVAHILGAWSTHSCIVLDRTRPFTIRMVTDKAETVNTMMDDHNYLTDLLETKVPEPVTT